MIASPYLSHYEHSHALVIGIDTYRKLPPLQSAVRDAKAVAHILAEKLGFEVTLLLDNKATRDAILSHVNDIFSNTHPDDRVLVYFAGHGITRRTTSGDNVGLLMPYGVEPKQYHQAIEMDHLVDQSKFIPAKHILFILDACFSGLAMTRGDTSGCLLKDLMTRRAVQAIAAGQEDQMVADLSGPGGHSIFTGLLLERLEQPGKLLTGNELGLYLQRQVGVHTKSRQTPHYGHLLGSQGGDFVVWAEEESEEPIPPEQALSRDAENAVIPASRLSAWWQVGLLALAIVISLLFGFLINHGADVSSTIFVIPMVLLAVIVLDYVLLRDWLSVSLFTLGAILWLVVSTYDPLELYNHELEIGLLVLAPQSVTGILLLWLIVKRFIQQKRT